MINITLLLQRKMLLEYCLQLTIADNGHSLPVFIVQHNEFIFYVLRKLMKNKTMIYSFIDGVLFYLQFTPLFNVKSIK